MALMGQVDLLFSWQVELQFHLGLLPLPIGQEKPPDKKQRRQSLLETQRAHLVVDSRSYTITFLRAVAMPSLGKCTVYAHQPLRRLSPCRLCKGHVPLKNSCKLQGEKANHHASTTQFGWFDPPGPDFQVISIQEPPGSPGAASQTGSRGAGVRRPPFLLTVRTEDPTAGRTSIPKSFDLMPPTETGLAHCFPTSRA